MCSKLSFVTVVTVDDDDHVLVAFDVDVANRDQSVRLSPVGCFSFCCAGVLQ